MSDPSDSLLRVAQRSSDNQLVFQLSGELDLSSAPVLEDSVAAMRPLAQPLTVDMSDVRFVDSTGLRALNAARRAALEDTGRPMTLVGCTEGVLRLLQLSGLTEVFLAPG